MLLSGCSGGRPQSPWLKLCPSNNCQICNSLIWKHPNCSNVVLPTGIEAQRDAQQVDSWRLASQVKHLLNGRVASKHHLLYSDLKYMCHSPLDSAHKNVVEPSLRPDFDNSLLLGAKLCPGSTAALPANRSSRRGHRLQKTVQ